MRSKQSCIRIKESSKGKMGVKICEMVDKCNCKKPNCCVASKGEKDNGA